MTIEEFFRFLDRKRDSHRLHPGVSARALTTWEHEHGQRLPRAFAEFLSKSNGINLFSLFSDRDTPQGLFEIHGLESIRAAQQVDGDDTLPSHWYLIGRDADGQDYLVLDTECEKYFKVDAIRPHEPLEEWESLEELLDWLVTFEGDGLGSEPAGALQQQSPYRKVCTYDDLHAGAVVLRMLGHKGSSTGVRFCGGERAIACGVDKTIRSWSLTAGKQNWSIQAHTNEVTGDPGDALRRKPSPFLRIRQHGPALGS